MILLILLYVSFSFTFALPTPSDLPSDVPLVVFTRSADTFGTRSIWAIIWSCLSTLFACTWIAVHPNIPGPKDSQWAILRRRLAIMGYILIAPEFVIAWAARQHFGARQFAKRYEGHGWTMAHGFFIIMGGFTLHDEQGTALRILESTELEELSKAGKVAWPSITEEEIQDRSKGDYLSKGVALVQTSWFIVQCIVRGVYRLETTELEVVTLAFATLTGVTYYLWWDKPIGVRCSVAVHLIQQSNQVHVDSDPQSPTSEDTQIRRKSLIAADSTPNPREPTSIPTPEPNFTRMQQFFAFIQLKCQKYGSFLGLIYVFLLHPLRLFMRAFSDMTDSNTLHNSSPLRVPTFYALKHDRLADVVCVTVAVLLGAIHCLAWSFHFPTLQERLAWRLSAASVVGGPILIVALVITSDIIEPRLEGPTILRNIFKAVYMFTWFVMFGVVALYLVSRILLLTLPWSALRALPSEAFVDIQWTSFFPHIG